ncbi:DNA replication protein SLD5 [Pneumocystis jirovecii RU7]|uniref:DNA replication complex GINS protein SLD5 n=1 Tax=Pneumocystis jirovecii (strain RU7) TaxID=1408657 RepID=A0A0W4ZRZ5_PNEJ7|nr:DNA replication protein SLD5 [Pneumocystis jirovecii RU7]KTW31145.1 hypothetical protein T551_01218 [Pneumocystis jirovecii RU7]
MDLDIDALLELEPVFNKEDEGKKDVSELMKSWISERIAPELLPFQGVLLERMMERTEMVELKIGKDIKTNFRMVLVQMEIERIKYMIRSYLQTRIYKMDKYALYILQKPELLACLSSLEKEYLKKHQEILTDYYTSAVLKHLPEKLRRLDDTQGGISMIEKPDMDAAVFCRVINNIEHDIPVNKNESITLDKGNIYLLKYKLIRSFIFSGDVELI